MLHIDQAELQRIDFVGPFWYQRKALVELNKCESRLQNVLGHNYSPCLGLALKSILYFIIIAFSSESSSSCLA